MIQAIEDIHRTLTIHKGDISLQDVVNAEGRSQAQKVLRERLAVLDGECGELQRVIVEAERRMKETESKTRKLTIKQFFIQKLSEFTGELDVRLPDATKDHLGGLQIGRGSEGPRARAAYYYAFLHTARKFGSSAFCPIVIDAPNQQGQDRGHLEQILRFLVDKAPDDAQVIIASETTPANVNAVVSQVSNEKDQILRDDLFDIMSSYFRPYLQQLAF